MRQIYAGRLDRDEGTDIFEKRGDNWLVVQEHASVPMVEPSTPAGKSK